MLANKKASTPDLPDHMDVEASNSEGNYTNNQADSQPLDDGYLASLGNPAPPPDQKHEQEFDELPVWPVLSPLALRGFAGDFISLACNNSEADPAAVLLTFIVRYGVEVGRHAFLNVGDTKHFLRLAGVVVGASGKSRKGTSARPVAKLFNFEQSARSSPGPFSSGEGITFAVRDAVKSYDSKLDQEITVDPGITDKRFFILDEEFSGLLANTKREGNTLSCVLRSAWDTGNLDPLTKTSKTRATGAHIGWLSHITLEELLLKLPQSEGLNGFGNRILWCCARRSKLVALPEPMDEVALERLQTRLRKNLDWAQLAGLVTLSDEARRAWADRFYAELGREKSGFCGIITNRAEAQTLRLAMAYSLLDRSVQISLAHLEAGLALWRYCEASAALIFRGRMADPTQAKIIEALKNGPMSGSEIRRAFSGHISRNTLQGALAELASSAKISSRKIETPGRPQTEYFLKTPSVKSALSSLSPQAMPEETLKTLKTLKTPGAYEKPAQRVKVTL